MTNVRLRTDDAVREIPHAVLLELAETVGAQHVLTEQAALVAGGADWWPLTFVWRHRGEQPALPAVVVQPTSTEQVSAVLRIANEAAVPVTPSAGRSGVCGGSLPVRGGIDLDLRRLDRVRSIDVGDLTVTVEAGVFGPALEDALRAEGLTLGHFPQSFDLSTVGGWIACRAAGQYSNRYGKIEHMVQGLEVVLADGRVMRTNPQPAASTGPDLSRLFLGSEGTLGVVTEATLQVWPAPEATAKRAFTYGSFGEGLEAQRRIMRRNARVACLRLYDGPETARHFELPDDRCALIVLSEGGRDEVEREMTVVDEEALGFEGVTIEDPDLVDRWLEHRNDVSALDEVISKGIVVDTIEVAAPWSRLEGIYESVQREVLSVEGTLICTAHASHAYLSGGCLYFTFAGVPGDDREAIDRYYRACWDATMRQTRAGGGTISHHHGIGIVRDRHLAEELGAGLDVLRAVKVALDPNGTLNPGKLGLGPTVWP